MMYRNGLECIVTNMICDGVVHCGDGSDERKDLCSKRKCQAGYWRCKDNVQCILSTDSVS